MILGYFFKSHKALKSIFSCFLFFSVSLQAEAKSLVVVIPSYNNCDWYKWNLDSVVEQKYSNFRVIYLDDCSSDGTGDLVEKYIRERQLENQIMLIRNNERKGALANIYTAVWMCAPDEIVVNLDGDDWFAFDGVLELLNELYANPDVWMTYGQYRNYPDGTHGHCEEIPAWVIEANCFRRYPWVSSHLRTYYAALFQKLRLEDLLCDSQFFSVAWDLAFMYPMLEMSGVHSRFLPEVVYVYNQATPINDHKLRRDLQIHYAQMIQRRACYCPIPQLFEVFAAPDNPL